MTTKESTFKAFVDSFRYPFYFIVLIWGIHLFTALGVNFAAWGIYPRSADDIWHIFTAPLVHGDWQHLMNNSVPFFVVGTLIMLFYRRVAFRAFIVMYTLTGLAVWLFGRAVSAGGTPLYHIGASGVIFSMVTFTMWNGILQRNVKSIIVTLIVTLLYGSMFIGVLPNQPGVSWESHLLGALVGIFTAYLFRDTIKQIHLDEYEAPVYTPDEPEKTYFEPDTFSIFKPRQEPDIPTAQKDNTPNNNNNDDDLPPPPRPFWSSNTTW
jgi:membrane associated rhomboid family serine protease